MPAGPVVILLGPPGVGKGTQGVLLADEMEWRHLATGDLLRSHRREGTALGRQAQEYMDKGELVPDPLIVDMVREVLSSLQSDTGVVFDGFPRTVPQAEALADVLEEGGRRVGRVIVLEADDDTIVERLSGRRSCTGCGTVYHVSFNPPRQEERCDRCGGGLVLRKDDEPETVKRRLAVYREETAPLVAFYERTEGTLQRVAGDRSLEEVRADVRIAAGVPGLLGDAMEVGA